MTEAAEEPPSSEHRAPGIAGQRDSVQLVSTPRVTAPTQRYLASPPLETREQILRNTVVAVPRNEQTLQRADLLFGLAILLLVSGTIAVGMRTALLVA